MCDDAEEPTPIAAPSTALVSASTGPLTIWGTPRPPAPPSQFVYNAEEERRTHCRSLLTAEEVASLDDEIKRTGHMTIEQVRDIIKNNAPKESQNARGETYAIDPEFMMLVDTRINQPVFITGDNVYTREELYEHFPFHDLRAEPESVFAQQEIGVFPARKYAMDADEFEYVARDLGDETIEFVMIEDQVAQVTAKSYRASRAPVKIVKTKVFLGKERWEEFQLVHRVAIGIVNVTGGSTHSPFLAAMLGAAPARAALMDEPTLLRQQKAMEEGIRRREAEAARREAEAARREEENRKTEARLEASLARFEEMLLSGRPPRAAHPHRSAAAESAASEGAPLPVPATSSREDNIAAKPADDDAELLAALSAGGRPADDGAAPTDSVPL